MRFGVLNPEGPDVSHGDAGREVKVVAVVNDCRVDGIFKKARNLQVEL